MLTRAVKLTIPRVTRIWYTGRIRKELLLKSTIIGVPTALTPYPFPSLVFLLTSLSECSLDGPHKINTTGPEEFFTFATRLEGTCKFSSRLQYCLQLKNFTVPGFACKEEADPCKFYLTVTWPEIPWDMPCACTDHLMRLIHGRRSLSVSFRSRL